MIVTGVQLVQQIENYAPLKLKMEHDPTGLQLGNLHQPVQRVLTTLDVRPEVVQEAIEQKVDFIFAHHPVMFHPAHNLDTSIPQNKMYADLLSHQITVYAAHTNMDKTQPGMNDWLAQALKLQNIQSFGADQDGVALGRWGTLSQPQTVLQLAQYIKQTWALSGLRIIANNIQTQVQKVGIIGGDGGKFYPQAQANNLDVLITGDVYYHTAHDMLAAGLNVIDPGHHIEAVFIEQTKILLEQWSQKYHWQLTILASKTNTEPFKFI
ncbi:Nif3-like dinuclear metal center hexameric protein [Bombilactobacillus bombi]|uniref:Nif3-like dinuclear metal center hexameric protein n=1 Tax=Bombilactobacillus bombi TaxID=1303590 RepID=UPI0015E5F585|nr:Nif3-like dinuclear metal center hexameric protein [Bombilactobacillus bombi]MBA1435060.1 Nif3-like dinuclear metal center hexameric protein [Bombilactobacillus bombi]